MYFATIDVLLTELNDRFSELNLSLLRSLEALVPTTTEFLHAAAIKSFLIHYDLSEAAFISEAATARRKQTSMQNEYDSDTFHKVYHHLSQVQSCFPTILCCYQIAMTMGMNTATAEELFDSSTNQDVSFFIPQWMRNIYQTLLSSIQRSIIQTLERDGSVSYRVCTAT